MKPLGQTKRVKKMKFLSDQDGILTRYSREKETWKAHLDNTRQFILDSFDDKKIKSIAVLGSGWLLDLPLEKLADKYKKILLVDVHHPAQIVKKTESMKNVTLAEIDISGGGIAFCWKLRKQKEEHLESFILDEFEPKVPSLPFDPDAYISLNLLNQLDILLIDFLQKKNRRVTDMEIRRFREKLQSFHVSWITKKPGCLITDVAELLNQPGKEIQERSLIYTELPKGKRAEEWIWDFDLSKTYHPNTETRMKVNAIEW